MPHDPDTRACVAHSATAGGRPPYRSFCTHVISQPNASCSRHTYRRISRDDRHRPLSRSVTGDQDVSGRIAAESGPAAYYLRNSAGPRRTTRLWSLQDSRDGRATLMGLALPCGAGQNYCRRSQTIRVSMAAIVNISPMWSPRWRKPTRLGAGAGDRQTGRQRGARRPSR